MVTAFRKTKSGPGLIAEIESSEPWHAFDQLKILLMSYYAKHGAVLEDKEYFAHQVKNKKPTWILELVYKERIPGRIKIQYLGESHHRKLWRPWKSQDFLVYFNFGNENTGKTRRDRFKQFVQPD